MRFEFRQRLFPFITALIFLVPSFQYQLNMPEVRGMFSDNEFFNAAMIIGLQIVPVFALMEFLEWRQRGKPESPRSRVSLGFIPACLISTCRYFWYVIVGMALAYVAVGILAVYLSTVVLDAPYKFWVWGLTVALVVLLPWGRAINFLLQRRRSTET